MLRLTFFGLAVISLVAGNFSWVAGAVSGILFSIVIAFAIIDNQA